MSKNFSAAIKWVCFAGILGCTFLASTTAAAQDEPLLIANSRSPDGKLEIWIKPVPPGQGYASGTAQIRSVATGKTLDNFEWSGFGESPDSKAFTVLWRPDCRYFVITWEISRGYVTSTVYGIRTDKRWTEVKLPSDDYVSAIKKMSGLSDLPSGKGHETPERWLPDGRLALEFGSRNIFYDGDGDLEKAFEVILQVNSPANEPLPIARIVSIKLKPR